MERSPYKSLPRSRIRVKTITGHIDGASEQANQPVLALGVGSTGPLDRQHGCIQNPYTLPGWENGDMVTLL